MILPLYYKGMLLTKTQDQKIVIDYLFVEAIFFSNHAALEVIKVTLICSN